MRSAGAFISSYGPNMRAREEAEWVVAAIPWSIPAACMVPDARTAQEGKYLKTAGVVKFAVGQSGSIVFFAPITASLAADRYVLRAILEREDSGGPNAHPPLLGTNVVLQRRGFQHGVDTMLRIDHELVIGQDGLYTVDSPGRDLGEINIQKHFYWLQLEVKQAQPATAQTRNAVIGLQLL